MDHRARLRVPDGDVTPLHPRLVRVRVWVRVGVRARGRARGRGRGRGRGRATLTHAWYALKSMWKISFDAPG